MKTMKKLLLFLFVPLFIACGNDDDIAKIEHKTTYTIENEFSSEAYEVVVGYKLNNGIFKLIKNREKIG